MTPRAATASASLWSPGSTTPLPTIDAPQWSLSVTGAVERELELAYDDLDRRRGVTAVIDCTGGWYSEQDWRGVPVADVLDQAGTSPNAASITVTSATGYYRRFSMEEAREYVLATHVGGSSSFARPRLPRQARGSGKARLRVGEVGDVDRGQRVA